MQSAANNGAIALKDGSAKAKVELLPFDGDAYGVFAFVDSALLLNEATGVKLGDIPLGHPRAVSGQRRLSWRLSPRFQIQRVRTYRPTVRKSTRRCVTRPARAETNPTQTFQNVVRQCHKYHGEM